jgi:hypothetical protein
MRSIVMRHRFGEFLSWLGGWVVISRTMIDARKFKITGLRIVEGAMGHFAWYNT